MAKRKLGIGRNQIYALTGKGGNVTTNLGKVVKIALKKRSRHTQDRNVRTSRPEELDIPSVTTAVGKKALEITGEDRAKAGILKDVGQM